MPRQHQYEQRDEHLELKQAEQPRATRRDEVGSVACRGTQRSHVSRKDVEQNLARGLLNGLEVAIVIECFS